MRKSIYTKKGADLRAWLKQGRRNADLTMRALASQLDVPFQMIAKIESGERRLDLIEYVLYCQALDADPYEGLALVAD